MTTLYDNLHDLFNSKKRFQFPYYNEIDSIPLNGIYLMFENGEKYKNWDRIVRVGTHTGKNQLRSRLFQHYLNQNKNRSIFRKHIGRAILNKNNNPYLAIWNMDSTSRVDRIKNECLIDKNFENGLEIQISNYIQGNISFSVFEVLEKEDRIFWESRIISTLAGFHDIKPSDQWLGLFSPKSRIQDYGLWQINKLFNKPLDLKEFDILTRLTLKCNST
jgi:hypothetical protein